MPAGHEQLRVLTDSLRHLPDSVTKISLRSDTAGYQEECLLYRGEGDEVYAEWRAATKVLATCPNVRMKLGGLAMVVNGFDFHEKVLPPSSGELADAWRPYMEALIEDFGADRCMFESNFPVDKAMCSYPVLWNAYKRIASGCSAAEKAALFHDTAAGFYRLG